MVLVSPSALVVKSAPQNVCCQRLCPQGVPQLPPASSRSSRRSASESESGVCQIIVSALGFRVCEILCVPFKSLWFPQPFGSPKSMPASLKCQKF